MEIEVLATLLGVALAALVAACGAGFRWLRSDFHRLEARVDRLESKVDRLGAKVDRLEAKVDSLIMALARSGILIDSQIAAPGVAPSTTGSPSTSPHAARSPPPEASGPEAAPA